MLKRWEHLKAAEADISELVVGCTQLELLFQLLSCRVPHAGCTAQVSGPHRAMLGSTGSAPKAIHAKAGCIARLEGVDESRGSFI